jgi:hypothetical protein
MLRFYKAFPELQEQAFYPKAAIYDAIDQYGSDLHTAYEQLPSTEIWGEQTFHLAMQQMEQLHEQQLMTTDTFLVLLEELQQLANQCERYAKKGLKSADTTQINTHRPTYKLYLNKTFNVNEHTLLSWHQHGIELTHVFHPVYGVAVTRPQKESIIHYCYTLLDEGTLISQTNANVRRSFFRKIHTAIRRRQERSTRPKQMMYQVMTA